MGLIAPAQSADGQTIEAADINNPINTIADLVNGNIDNDNIKAAAGIDGSKLADASVTNAKLAFNTAWSTWSPTMTGMTLGNGSSIGYYAQIGKTVFFRWYFLLGSTSAMGTNPYITYPVTPKSGTAHFASGTGATFSFATTMLDAGSEYYFGRCLMDTNSGGRLLFYAQDITSTSVSYQGITATAPFTWATNDTLSVTGTYEAN